MIAYNKLGLGWCLGIIAWVWVAGSLNAYDEKTPFEATQSADAQLWMQQLKDPSYRVRREAFLKLCDRELPIDEWLSRETKSGDKYRSAVAVWLKRLRQSTGTMEQRIEMLSDFEALRENDESVLERYVEDGRWEQLIELLSLVEPPRRIEFLNSNSRIETIVSHAWRTDCERFIPRFLDLVMLPTRRPYANKAWRELGMPEEWQVSEQTPFDGEFRMLPSVQVTQLEAHGKLDEAVELAKKSGTWDFVERLLIRANAWDKWLSLDSKRIIAPDSALYQQAAMLTILGRSEQANAKLNAQKKSKNTASKNAELVLALALGRTDDFENRLSKCSAQQAFDILMYRGRVRDAFSYIGMKGLEVDDVKEWLDQKIYETKGLYDEVNESPVARESILIDFASRFQQLGYLEQCECIENHVIEKTLAEEDDQGIDIWYKVIWRWLGRGREKAREKSIKTWHEALLREDLRGRKAVSRPTSQNNFDERMTRTPWDFLYPQFRMTAPQIYQYLYQTEISKISSGNTLSAETKSQVIATVLAQMENLHLGVLPEGWKQSHRLHEMRHALLKNEQRSNARYEGVVAELAKLFDSLGETELALETLSSAPPSLDIQRDMAEYHARLGNLPVACELLVSEFQANGTDLILMLELIDNLTKLGRYSEVERYRLQGLSSVSEPRKDMIEHVSIRDWPVRKEVQWFMEQLWNRDTNTTALVTLAYQFQQEAIKDLGFAKQAANYARIEALYRIKAIENSEPLRALEGFEKGFKSLVLEAIQEKDEKRADELLTVSHRCSPMDVDMPIDILPFAEKAFGKEFADRWFEKYYRGMIEYLEEFPDDSLYGNNTAWLAARCNRELSNAHELATKVVARVPSHTYLDTLAEVEYRRGNVERAIELSEQCRRLSPQDKHYKQQLHRFRIGAP